MKHADPGLNLSTNPTHKREREFLDHLNRAALRVALDALVTPHSPTGHRGRPLFPVETILCRRACEIQATANSACPRSRAGARFVDAGSWGAPSIAHTA